MALKLLSVVTIADYGRIVERSGPFTMITHPNLMSHVEAFVGTALTDGMDPGLDDFDVIYTVADWVDGTPLPDVLVDASTVELLGYVAGIARGLHSLHLYRSRDAPRGIIHRDVKPSNVRVTPQGVAVLIDFGVARPLGHDDLTQGVGTYRWRAPEVLSGSAPISTAVDAWGLGAIAYWTLTGQPPDLDGAPATREQLTHTSGCQRLPDPGGVASHIASLLATNPAHRPDDLGRWAAQLEDLLAGPRRGVSRLRPALGRGALAAVAVGVGLGLNAAGGASAMDHLTPTDGDVDRRVVVVSFDGRTEPPQGNEAPYLRATSYRDIATIIQRGGARAVGFVDFDSSAFSDGAAGRTNVITSAAMQTIAVAPLIDISATNPKTARIPVLTRYRVDRLASELAGVGLPSGPAEGVARTVLALARVETLADGQIVSIPESEQDEFSDDAGIVVPGLFLRLAELATGQAISEPSSRRVSFGGQGVPLERSHLAVRWSDALDDIDDHNVISSFALLTGEIPDERFRDAIVLVGTTDPASTDYVNTPVGALPEVLVQANALNTVLTEQFTRSDPSWLGGVTAAAAAVVMSCMPTRRKWLIVLIGATVVIGWLITVRTAAAGGLRLDALTVPGTAISIALLLGVRREVVARSERRQQQKLFSPYVARTASDHPIGSGRGTLSKERS